jgi:phospholipid/cholesterol/gamma-HCH transport system ATP-binding protein
MAKQIQIVNLYKSFGKKEVLKGVNLEIEEGETCAVIGRSGVGKSVLLKTIIGLVKPDRGKVEVFGNNIAFLKEEGLRKVRERIGVVFQGSALFDSLTVAQNVGFFLFEHTEKERGVIMEQVEDALSAVGLKGISHLYPHSLSGGMKKRVALARAIITKPAIILYDEPTAGIDPVMADEINALIRKLSTELSVTSIVVTHDIVSAYCVADRIAMLEDGKIIAEGRPEEIKRSENPYVRRFVSRANP